MTPSPDFTAITYGPGSLVLLRAEHAEARDHLEDNVEDGAVWMHGCLVVEPRYIVALIGKLEDNGYSVAVV